MLTLIHDEGVEPYPDAVAFVKEAPDTFLAGDALRAHGADVVVQELSELLGREE